MLDRRGELDLPKINTGILEPKNLFFFFFLKMPVVDVSKASIISKHEAFIDKK